MKYLFQPIVYMYIFIFNLSVLSAPAQAALIDTEAVAATQSRQATEDKIRAALSRDDVARQLTHLGVDPAEANQRVAALSDRELADVSDRIDRLPAGGDFFGTVGAIFIVLLITDILGFTKVFPFTRAQR
jgi:hypothetical protein